MYSSLQGEIMHSKVGGALMHAEGMKENYSGLRGVLMHSREGIVICEKGVNSRGNLTVLGVVFKANQASNSISALCLRKDEEQI